MSTDIEQHYEDLRDDLVELQRAMNIEAAQLRQENTTLRRELAECKATIRSQEKEIDGLQREAIFMAKENGKFRYYIVELERHLPQAQRDEAVKAADVKFCEDYPTLPEVEIEAENADLRRQLAETQAQLDIATRLHTAELTSRDDALGELEADLAFADVQQWPLPPATKWHEATERPAHDKPVLGYARWNEDGSLFPTLLMAKEPDWDDENRWLWTFDGEEVIRSNRPDELYAVVCWREVPPPPESARR